MWDCMYDSRTCTGGTMAQADVDKILKWINDRRNNLIQGTETNGPTGNALSPAKNMPQIQWNCDLEAKAKDAMGTTCTDVAPPKPADNAAFFAYGDPNYYTVDFFLNSWMSSIDLFVIDATSISATEVKYENNALREYANLVRSSTTAIGCSELKCDAISDYNLYCLTDQPYGDPNYYTVDFFLNSWMSSIDLFAIDATSISATEVKYENNALREYANLVRSSTTAIGCSELKCDATSEYNLYCLTDQP
ncbi:SCP-like protein [Oesophagostomum dentatum]|uniref:SCP-like protein n=1 Tax=Oesophagostomum dentatum TaxID=61180 RepID=A0A0B1SXQ6_OESDE|nr:SCP-like protein [Oesophagostomum dentatum]